MRAMYSDYEQLAQFRDAAGAHRMPTRSGMWAIRAALAFSAALLVVSMGMLHEEPLVMVIGLTPLALLAAECAWHVLGGALRED